MTYELQQKYLMNIHDISILKETQCTLYLQNAKSQIHSSIST